MPTNITRRTFLKATGALGAVAATMQLPQLQWLQQAEAGQATAPSGEEKVIRSMCRMCHGTCGTLVHVRNGRVVKVEGNPDAPTNHGTLCPKGLATVQHQYSPRRLRYPMKRVGNRGEGKWQRITWDEAYQMLADKFTDTWSKYGKQATALCGGTGRHWQDWYGIFGNALGLGVRFGMPPLCYLPRIEVITKMFGYRIPVADYFGYKGAKPKLVVYWGNNVTYSHADGMHGSRPLAAQNEGAKVIVIDPVFTNVAQKADLWLPIRPATDGALAMAFLNVIVNESLYDKEFVEKWSNLPGLVRDDNGKMLTEYDMSGKPPPEFKGPPFAIRPPEKIVFWDKDKNQAVLADSPDINPAMTGKFQVKLGDGSTVSCHPAWDDLVKRVNEYPPEKVAEITWIPQDKIVEAAHLIANTKGWALQWGVSFDQQGINSARSVQAAMMLVALTGDLDVPGGMAMWDPPAYRKGSFPGEIGPKYVSAEMNRMDLLPPEVSQLSAKYQVYPFARSHGDYVNREVAEGKVKFEILWVVGANPLVNSMNTKVIYEGMKKIPFIVTWDHYMTPTAQMSELVLPVAIWTEKDQVADMHLLWGLQARVQAVEPVGEARSDEIGTFLFAKKMAERDPEYWNKAIPWKTFDEFLDWQMEPMKMTFQQLKDQWLYVQPQKAYIYKETKFQLPAGKAELYVRAFQGVKQDPLPFWKEPPLMSPNNPAIAKDYPLICTTRRLITFFHSEFRQIPYLREIYTVPQVEINPKTAQSLGIADGDWVYIESPVGRIKQRALVTPGVDPRVVVSNHDWWFPEAAETMPDLGGVFESNQNLLTFNDPSQGYDPLSGTPQLRGFMVKVYKANDGPPKGLNPQTVLKWTPEQEA